MVHRSLSRRPASLGAGFLLFALIFLAGCSHLITFPRSVAPTQAWNMIQTNALNPDVVVIDVRSEMEYAREHIPRALNLDVQATSFRNDIDSLDRGKTYFLYCRAGNRSLTAQQIMNKEGFDRVVIIEGGFNAWARAGLRTVSSLDEQ